MKKIIEQINQRIDQLSKKVEPYHTEYNREYKLWMDGSKTPERKYILEQYEDHSKGLKMFELDTRIDELKGILKIILALTTQESEGK